MRSGMGEVAIAQDAIAGWLPIVERGSRKFSAAVRQLKIEKRELNRAKARAGAIEEARQIIYAVADNVQRSAYDRIAGVVSKCLEAVFDEPYRLVMDFQKKRGRTEVALHFERDGMRIDPMTASGGGVVDVASFALRLSALMLSRPPLRRLLVLDEPFKFVSADYRGRVRVMLEMLSAEMGVQIIMVTHIDELKSGKVVEL